MRSEESAEQAGDPVEPALERLLRREIRKIEGALALRRAAARRGLAREAAQPLLPDPAWPELDGLLPAPLGTAAEWMEERLAFLRFVAEALAGAGSRERAYLWLGAACSFLGAVPQGGAGVRAILERLGPAEEHYREVARTTGGAEDPTRRREEPWDASAGLVPRRMLRGAWLLAELRELLEEQGEALLRLEEGED
jgi:hypothetical protein